MINGLWLQVSMSKLTETTPEKSFNSTPTALLEDVYFAPLLQALQTPGIAPRRLEMLIALEREITRDRIKQNMACTGRG
jgi:hypothetical protein